MPPLMAVAVQGPTPDGWRAMSTKLTYNCGMTEILSPEVRGTITWLLEQRWHPQSIVQYVSDVLGERITTAQVVGVMSDVTLCLRPETVLEMVFGDALQSRISVDVFQHIFLLVLGLENHIGNELSGNGLLTANGLKATQLLAEILFRIRDMITDGSMPNTTQDEAMPSLATLIERRGERDAVQVPARATQVAQATKATQPPHTVED